MVKEMSEKEFHLKFFNSYWDKTLLPSVMTKLATEMVMSGDMKKFNVKYKPLLLKSLLEFGINKKQFIKATCKPFGFHIRFGKEIWHWFLYIGKKDWWVLREEKIN